jgi:hypothetical protein
MLRAGAVAVSAGLTMVALELAFRMAGYKREVLNPMMGFNVRDRTLGHRGRASYHKRFAFGDFAVDVETDAEGFRAPLRPPSPADGRPKVLVFGDSFVWGWGVSKGELFTDHLAAALPDRWVRNLGISNVGTVTEFRLFETGGFVQRLSSTDVVMVLFFRNDFEENVAGTLRADLEDDRVVLRDVDVRWEERLEDLRDRSFLFNVVSYRLEILMKERRAARLAARGPDAVAARVTRHYLSRFQDVCRERDARFLVVEIPDRALYGEGAIDEATLRHGRATHETLLALTRVLGIETLDLLPVFEDARREQPDVPLTFPRDAHWNANGHRLVATALADQLTRREAIPDRGPDPDRR